jgi:hypothetical protein
MSSRSSYFREKRCSESRNRMNDFLCFLTFFSVVHKIRYMNIHKSGLNAGFVKIVEVKIVLHAGA